MVKDTAENYFHCSVSNPLIVLNQSKPIFMYEIIQMDDDGEAVIDSKETEGEAMDFVSALNGMFNQEELKFYYRLMDNLNTN